MATSCWPFDNLGLGGHRARPGSLPHRCHQVLKLMTRPEIKCRVLPTCASLRLLYLTDGHRVLCQGLSLKVLGPSLAPPFTPHLQTMSKSFGPTLKAQPESNHFSSLLLKTSVFHVEYNFMSILGLQVFCDPLPPLHPPLAQLQPPGPSTSTEHCPSSSCLQRLFLPIHIALQCPRIRNLPYPTLLFITMFFST